MVQVRCRKIYLKGVSVILIVSSMQFITVYGSQTCKEAFILTCIAQQEVMLFGAFFEVSPGIYN